MAIKRCELKDCTNVLGPGASNVGFEIDGQTFQVRVCSYHTNLISYSPRGTWQITKDRELKAIPATFFIKKGKP